jgi:hypothetical protein
MLFTRHVPGLLGGTLKVFDYLEHVRLSGRFEPILYLRAGSVDISAYVASSVRVVDAPLETDAYFFAGSDWTVADQAGFSLENRVVINLIQGFRHLDPREPMHAHLTRPAVRICVSEPLARAIRASGLANGPLLCVPNGIDVARVTSFAASRAERVFIAGLKRPELARAVAAKLAGTEVDLCIERLPRDAFLARMGRCAVTVALPFSFEGFYLPALEAMALESVVVLARADGPASFCRDGVNAVVTADDAAMLAAAARALLAEPARQERLRGAARETARAHDLQHERRAVLALIDQLIEPARA